MKTVTIYSDPGHAWGKVKRSELEALGLLEKISCYSYQAGRWVYLEEDQDLGLYLAALGKPVSFRETYSDKTSRIRGYQSFNPSKTPLDLVEGELFSFHALSKTVYRLKKKCLGRPGWEITLASDSSGFVYYASKAQLNQAFKK